MPGRHPITGLPKSAYEKFIVPYVPVHELFRIIHPGLQPVTALCPGFPVNVMPHRFVNW